MDGLRFDSATRLLASGFSRRVLIGGIAGLLAGATSGRLASDAEAARKGPDACAAYCAGEPGPRGAQCRQACKECGGPAAPGFCHDTVQRSYTCCPEGQECFFPWSPEGQVPICCASGAQVCHDGDYQPFCCPDGQHCAELNLCCPEGTPACLDACTGGWICGTPGPDGYYCETSCFDRCQETYLCDQPDSNGYCPGTACWNPCYQEHHCGQADDHGNCPGTSCFDPGSAGYVCGDVTCYDPAYDQQVCGAESCYDPELDMTVCGPSCYDPETGQNVCGPTCRDRDIWWLFRCGTPDESGYWCPAPPPPCPGQAACDPEGSLCCDDPPGCCYDRVGVQMTCGARCYDLCTWEADVCGMPNEWGYCENSCFASCLGGYTCGEADEAGNCVAPPC